jgi:DNA polymerase-3 subunit delta
MILFLYGEDNYRLKHKLKDMKEKYISASLGDTNLAILDGKSVKADDIIRQVLAYPFLANKRLVILENFLKEGKKEVQEKIVEFLPKVPETTVLVFAENVVPDKRISIFKKLIKLAKVQEFKPLSDNAVLTWIDEESIKSDAVISPDGSSKLFEFVGSDLWQLSNEIAKLAAYNKKITAETVELLVKPQTSSDIFGLIDAVASHNKKRALSELYRAIENGDNELYILSMIVYQYRNMLVIKDLMDRGASSQYDLASKAKLHPFVVGKTTNLVRSIKIVDLKNAYSTLLDFDIAVKTGKMEPRTALDLLTVKLCQ